MRHDDDGESCQQGSLQSLKATDYCGNFILIEPKGLIRPNSDLQQ